MIKFYKKPSCVQCNAVERTLQQSGLELDKDYTFIDLTKDAEAFDLVANEMGYRQVPVLAYGDIHFAGFMPDKCAEIISAYQADKVNAPVPA